MYPIMTNYRKPVEITPSHLQESDFVRSGTLSDVGSDLQTQNARLLTPITITTMYGTIIYPKNAYIRLYHLKEGTYISVHLISPHPLPGSIDLPPSAIAVG
jgi:hypothetical protein